MRREPHSGSQVRVGHFRPPSGVMRLGPRVIRLELMRMGRDDLGGKIDGLGVGLQLALAARQIQQQVHAQLVKDLLVLAARGASGGAGRKPFDGVGIAESGLRQLAPFVEGIAVLQQLVQQRQSENIEDCQG